MFPYFTSIISTLAGALILNNAKRTARRLRSYHSHLAEETDRPISDMSHHLTKGLRGWILGNTSIFNGLTRLLMVHINLSLLIIVLRCTYDFRARLVTACVYLSKFILNLLYYGPAPEGRYDNNLIPNKKLLWSPQSQSETFFSGHTAMSVLSILFAPAGLKLYVVMGSIITISTLIVLRIHYIIDIIGALLVVYFFCNFIAS